MSAELTIGLRPHPHGERMGAIALGVGLALCLALHPPLNRPLSFGDEAEAPACTGCHTPDTPHEPAGALGTGKVAQPPLTPQQEEALRKQLEQKRS